VRQLETRLTPSLSTLASFVSHGVGPQGLVSDSSGNVYGTTAQGGTFNRGTVFELVHSSGKLTTLASFNGVSPEGPPVIDSSGNLYGTSWFGGTANDGTIFELAAGSGTITTLASFNGTDNGKNPDGPLVMDSSGNLYGTTYFGIPGSGGGTIFELAAGSGTITTLAWFNSYDQVGLTVDSAGNLHGTTTSGGAIFELAKGSETITTLASFDGTNGKYPQAGPIVDSAGNLYGTTWQGGAYGDGTIFELAKGSGTITALASFDGTDGANPPGGVALASRVRGEKAAVGQA
jgi:uncharacterized repeat protein (TIGR03803 family)